MTGQPILCGGTIKWIIPEADTPQALALRRQALSAPEPLVPECANALWRKVGKGELTAGEALFCDFITAGDRLRRKILKMDAKFRVTPLEELGAS